MTRDWRPMLGLGTSVVLLVCAVVATAAWVSAATSPHQAGTPRTGDIELAAAYLREPDGDWVRAGTSTRLVAWLHNRGDVEQQLVAVSSGYARVVASDGLPVAVPARGWVAIGPDGPAIGLRGLTRPVHAGDRVPVTFRFADGRQLSARVPVVREPTNRPTRGTAPLG